MPDNKFNITITATDRATKVVNKVNKQIGSIFRPYDNAKRSLTSFSQALGRNDLVKRPLWALEKVGKGVTVFGSTFGLAENSIVGGSARIASALGMIGGPVGGFLAAGAAIVGGSAAVSVTMAKMGQNIGRTAKGLNITTDQLQEYRGAAKLAGLETEVMDQSLQSMGKVLTDALAGRNQQVPVLMSQMGASIKKTKDGAVDTLATLRDVADLVSHMKDQNQARNLTDMLGITDLLPLLNQGTLKLDEYIGKVRRLGILSEEQVKTNEQQAQSWNQTKTAIDAAGVSVGNLIAKWLDLNVAAQSTSAVAEKLQKATGFSGAIGTLFSEAGKNIWNNGPWSWAARSIFGEIGKQFQGGGATGLWGSGATGTWGGNDASGGQVPRGNSPQGIRQNNPGNLRSWPGAGSAGGFATFATPQAGLSAMGKNLMAYQDKYGINTLGGVINRWAPAGDGNNVPAYLSDVSRQTGFGIDQKLDLHDPKVLAPLISAITKHENGQNPYTPEMIAQAVAAALRDSQVAKGGDSGERPIKLEVIAPPGVTVRAVRGLGQPTVGLTMQPGGAS
ncbi:hypothetical protein HHL11_07100 [Ramlibacter sp. G-1-2-2]|uniref:Uncharacterized protein n=1 Tax=Ramlibacter agri TaxID=2728837 RepID=A0A848H1X3_9BURK|nr:hypothetical protein [Ramlibacter agri]NML43509.1 hypothetical protein [Ramlibacter agri]